jgi:hypothetical protein
MTKCAIKFRQRDATFSLRKTLFLFVTKGEQQVDFLMVFIHIGELLLDCVLNKKEIKKLYIVLQTTIQWK